MLILIISTRSNTINTHFVRQLFWPFQKSGDLCLEPRYIDTIYLVKSNMSY